MAKVIMWLCVFGFVAAFALLAVGVAGWGTAQAMREADPATALARAEAARHEAEINRVREAQAREWARTTTDVVNVVKLPFALMMSALCVMAALGVWGYMQLKAMHAQQFVDVQGIPVSRPLAYQGATLGIAADRVHLLGLADVEAARNPVHALPAGLRNYAPRYGNQAARVESLPAPDAPALPAPDELPGFGRLLTDGKIKPGHIVVGFDEQGALLSGPMPDFARIGVCGLSGMGKTHTAALIAAQTALGGARLAVLDPHYMTMERERSLARKLDPLHAAYFCPPGVDDDTMLMVIDVVQRELDARKRGKAGPWVFVFGDEWTALMDRSSLAEPLSRLLVAIIQEGGKFHMGALLMGQNWRADLAGGSPLRDSLNVVIVHRSKPPVARLIMPDLKASSLLQLKPGQAYLDTATGERALLSVPYLTDGDLVDVARRLPRPTGGGPNLWPNYSPNQRPNPAPAPFEGVETAESAGSPESSAKSSVESSPVETLTAKARRCRLPVKTEHMDWLALLDQGMTPAAIATTQRQGKKGEGWQTLKANIESMQKFVENWPAGETWAAEEGEDHAA